MRTVSGRSKRGRAGHGAVKKKKILLTKGRIFALSSTSVDGSVLVQNEPTTERAWGGGESCMCEQVVDCIRQILDERSEAARCGKFGHINLNRVLNGPVFVVDEVDERE